MSISYPGLRDKRKKPRVDSELARLDEVLNLDINLKCLEDKYQKAIQGFNLQALSLKESPFPLGPAYGSNRTEVDLRTNYFKLDIGKDVALRLYDVSVVAGGRGGHGRGRGAAPSA